MRQLQVLRAESRHAARRDEGYDRRATDAARKTPTLADLEALPPDVKGEIIEGVLYTMTRPRGRHHLAATLVGEDLSGPFKGGLWLELGMFSEETDARIEPFAAVALDIASWWV